MSVTFDASLQVFELWGVLKFSSYEHFKIIVTTTKLQQACFALIWYISSSRLKKIENTTFLPIFGTCQRYY